MELFLRTRAGVNATGDYDPISKTLTVKKGSIVSPDVHTTGKFRSANSVRKYRELYCDGIVTKEDVVFKSASTAANFVTGRSTNGLIAWKDKDGRILKSLIED
jgi:hypothetical protein